ncbi:MAG: hypothetical protein RIB67_11165 [Miltoncostaeaceae bacterium]
MRRFVIRPDLRLVRIVGFRTGTSAFRGRVFVSLTARVATNAGDFTGPCRLHRGRRVPSTQRISYSSLDPVKPNAVGCPRLTIPPGLRAATVGGRP